MFWMHGICIAFLSFVFLALGYVIQEAALSVNFSVELDEAFLPWFTRGLDDLDLFWNIKDFFYCWGDLFGDFSAGCFDIAIFT